LRMTWKIKRKRHGSRTETNCWSKAMNTIKFCTYLECQSDQMLWHCGIVYKESISKVNLILAKNMCKYEPYCCGLILIMKP
jgi:hypothetical protein